MDHERSEGDLLPTYRALWILIFTAAREAAIGDIQDLRRIRRARLRLRANRDQRGGSQRKNCPSAQPIARAPMIDWIGTVGGSKSAPITITAMSTP